MYMQVPSTTIAMASDMIELIYAAPTEITSRQEMDIYIYIENDF